jgi:hypothetical protein
MTTTNGRKMRIRCPMRGDYQRFELATILGTSPAPGADAP